jgi:RNA polymerase sigma factor (sigma-70 family)
MITGDRGKAAADPSSTRKGGKLMPEPLTRRGYKRRPAVERRIKDALASDGAALQTFAQQRDETAADYFPPEALVYFIRRAARSGGKRIVHALFRELYERCTPFLRGRARGFDKETRKEIIQEVFARIAAHLLDPTDKADFAEVSFWSYLKCLCIDVIRERIGELENPVESLDASRTDADEDQSSGLPNQIADYALSPEQMLILREGLARLPPKLRQVFIMAHALEMKIDSKNPNEMTLSRHFGVSEKTIRTWLKDADKLLAAFQEEQNG